MVDHWADVFLDELAKHVDIQESDVEKVLRSQGVSAEALNGLVGTKQAGLGNLVKALGGWIAHGVWHAVTAPFIGIRKLISSPQFRTEFKAAFRRALSHEIRATKHMMGVAGRLARGEEVKPEEKKAAMHQLVDVLAKVVLVYFAGPSVANLFSGGVWKALMTVLSPIDEILVVLLNKPIRAALAKLLSADISTTPV